MSKKDFTGENPAMSYLSIDLNPSKTDEIKYKPNPLYIETKSKKMQILIQPTVFKELKKYAKEHGISANETVNQAIKNFLNLDI